MKTRRISAACASLFVCGLVCAASAEVQTFQITGLVSSFSAPYQTNTFGITAGDAVTGFLRYDPNQPGWSRHPGDPAMAYDVSLGGLPFLTFTVRGQEFDLSANYLNVYYHGLGIDFDEISTAYNGSDGTHAHTPFGDFVSGTLNQGDFTLLNGSGTALSDCTLPSMLNADDWPSRYILLNQAPSASGGVEYGGFYLRTELTSIVAVPEPGAAGFLAAAGAALLLRNIRRNQNSARH